MRKLILSLLFILFMVSFTDIASASSVLLSDEFFNKYDLNKETIQLLIENNEIQDEKQDINSIGDLCLSKGFDELKESTFSDSKNISGEGKEGLEVIVAIYYQDDEVSVLTYENNEVLGNSNMYVKNLALNHIGDNYILIIVKNGDSIDARQFIVNKKEQEIKELLESEKLNLTEELKQEPKQKTKKDTDDESLINGIQDAKIGEIYEK